PCFSRPTAATMIRMACAAVCRSYALARLLSAHVSSLRARPHLFDLIEVAHFRPEHMHDDIAGIDQDPITMRHALDANVADTGFVQVLEQAVSDRAYLPIGPSGGHNQEVGECALGGEIDGDGVLSLHVVNAGEDEAKDFLGVRTHLGNRVGGATCADPGDCRCGQGLAFPFTSFHCITASRRSRTPDIRYARAVNGFNRPPFRNANFLAGAGVGFMTSGVALVARWRRAATSAHGGKPRPAACAAPGWPRPTQAAGIAPALGRRCRTWRRDSGRDGRPPPSAPWWRSRATSASDESCANCRHP